MREGVTPIGEIEWRDGTLVSRSPGSGERAWTRPADLAEARLETDAARWGQRALPLLSLADGRELLAAAFTVVPFARGPLPEPSFGDGVTPPARAAFRLFLGLDGKGDAFRVMRGEPDDFLVCARRFGGEWRVGAFTADATTLTLRFEDVWELAPPELRSTLYDVDVMRDGEPATLRGIAPDARIFTDLAANGGFFMKFVPSTSAQ